MNVMLGIQPRWWAIASIIAVVSMAARIVVNEGSDPALCMAALIAVYGITMLGHKATAQV